MSGDEVVTLRAERDGVVVAEGVLDPRGSATAPDDPSIRIERITPDADLEDDVRGLVERLVAKAGGGRRVVIAWDPMDAAGLRMLEAMGFRPTGEMPYFELGPGHVEYVTGYMDATGAKLDLAIETDS